MSFVERPYPDIARDMLTTLTGGIAGESYDVAYKSGSILPESIVLKRRPVARVSSVLGVIEEPGGAKSPVVFGLNDYELIAGNAATPDVLDAIRFLPFGKRPAPGTRLLVNYYPRTTEPTPVTDVSVGSVARTLLEAVAKELAALYAQLNLAYDSGFIETATGASLDRVVALLGTRRHRAGRAAGFVTFTRRAGSPGDITIPAGTPITDKQDKIRYETTDTHLMRAGETTAEVRVHGAAESTPVVEPGTLTVIARLVAGLSDVTNERTTARAASDESDDDLRLRARGALTASDKGTVEALRHGLLELKEVRDVRIEERPKGAAGEIGVTLSLATPGEVPQVVRDRIEELRPAGIRVTPTTAAFRLQASLQLLLKGSSLPAAEVTALETNAAKALAEAIAARAIGEKVRIRPLVAALLGDPRIADVTLMIGPLGGTLSATSDIAIPDGFAAELAPANLAVKGSVFEDAAGVVRFEVSARMAIGLVPPAALADAQSVIRRRLEAFAASLRPAQVVNYQAVLLALRDDSKYAIDPVTLIVTIDTPGEALMIAMGSRSFTVGADQQFEVTAVDVVEGDPRTFDQAVADADAVAVALFIPETI